MSMASRSFSTERSSGAEPAPDSETDNFYAKEKTLSQSSESSQGHIFVTRRIPQAGMEILEKAGLETKMHAYGTNVEGEWEAVFGALKRCHETLHEMGAPRVSTNLRLGTRTDREQTMQDKIDSVARKR